MSGDLVSLRMVLVGAAPPHQDLWREGAAQASVPIDFEWAMPPPPKPRHRPGRRLGRKDAVESDAVYLGISRVRHRRHVREGGSARLARHRQGAQLAALQMLRGVDKLLEADVDIRPAIRSLMASELPR